MEIRSFLIIFVVAFALLHYGEAKICYKCDSRISKTCAFPSLREITECATTKCATCYISTKDLFNDTEEILIRSCGTDYDSEPLLLYFDVFCEFCDKDLCNKFNNANISCNNANMATVSMTLRCLVLFWAIRFILTNSY